MLMILIYLIAFSGLGMVCRGIVHSNNYLIVIGVLIMIIIIFVCEYAQGSDVIANYIRFLDK